MKTAVTVSMILAVITAVCPAYGQEGATTGSAPVQDLSVNVISPSSVSVNNLKFRTIKFVCGGLAQQGTPIAANNPPDAGNKTSGSLTISGIPPTASVVRADLFWTVLTNSDPATSTTGETILLNGAPVTGFRIGTPVNETPCFPQAYTIAYRAIVTNLITPPGNGVYTVSGAPGGPDISSDFTEGATLQILWSEPNGPLMEDNLYHAIAEGDLAGPVAVTRNQLFSQTMAIFGTNAAGPVSATLYEVIGNGQVNATENLLFDGPCPGDINLDNTLDGSTSSRAPGTCSSTIAGNQCFWDDDVVAASSQFACAAGNNATSADLISAPSESTNDCFDWDALNLLTSTDAAHVCSFCGIFVDNRCPPDGVWKNHGQYVSCVAHAAEDVLSGLPFDGTCPREEIQSCCVNPRARSDVGKKK